MSSYRDAIGMSTSIQIMGKVPLATVKSRFWSEGASVHVVLLFDLDLAVFVELKIKGAVTA